MFWIPLSYLVVSTLTPGPVTIMTVHNAIRHGRTAGTAVGLGGTVTTVVFVTASLLVVHTQEAGLQLQASTFYQQGGALFILMLGILSGYKVLFAGREEAGSQRSSAHLGRSFFMGMGLMTPYFPQTLIFYTVIVPAHELPTGLAGSILLLGLFKIGLTLGWYSLLARGAGSIQAWFFNHNLRRVVELTAAFFLLAMSMTLLLS